MMERFSSWCLLVLVLLVCSAFVTCVGAQDPDPTFTVVYDANWPVGFSGVGSVPIDANEYVEGATVTVLANSGSLMVSGYSFLGWSAESSAMYASFLGGSTFLMPDEDVTLYAVWGLSSGSGDTSVLAGESSFAVGTAELFILFGVIVVLIWVLAIVRQTIGMCVLSSVFWFIFGFSLLRVGDLDMVWVPWFAYVSVFLGVVMMLLTFLESGRAWRDSMNGKVEEAVL